jgi:hypothetical protein
MANTDVVLALPSFEYKGATIATGRTTWTFSDWLMIDDSVKTNIVITGFTYMTMSTPAVDTTHESLFEIGVGDLGSPVTKIQIPTSQRSDTAVAIYLPPRTIFLPEPHEVTAGKAIYLRVASGVANQSFNGVRLLIQGADKTPVSPLNVQQNNYRHVHVPTNMGTSFGGFI